MKNFMYLLALTACLSLNVHADEATAAEDEAAEAATEIPASELLSDDEAADAGDDE